MQLRYPDDKFDVVLRKTTEPTALAEWRVKCLDCPGKVCDVLPLSAPHRSDVTRSCIHLALRRRS